MPNKNHGDGQNDDDERKIFQIIMIIMIALTAFSIIIEIATWFIGK